MLFFLFLAQMESPKIHFRVFLSLPFYFANPLPPQG